MRNEFIGSKLVIYLDGRIDSNNAEAVAQEINQVLSGQSFDQLVLDLADLEYISSAGLRVVLRLRKSYSSLKLVNVTTDVYEIFDMTGFTELMPVEKAYKKISVDGCEVIGEGANGKVYRIDPETIVKVYANPDSFEDIQRERSLAKKAFVLGVNTAISYDIVQVGKLYGTVFELLNAKSLAACITQEPDKLDHYVDIYVDLLKKIHSIEVEDEDIPNIKELALRWVNIAKTYLDEDVGAKLEQLVKAVPESHHLIHGDYHLKNVMVQNGEAILIDMDTLCVGNPVFEFGSVFNAYIGFHSLDMDHAGDFLGITADESIQVWHKTLQKYFDTTDEETLKGYAEKAQVIGYTRLLQRAVRRTLHRGEDHAEEIAFYKKELAKLIASVDSLAF